MVHYLHAKPVLHTHTSIANHEPVSSQHYDALLTTRCPLQLDFRKQWAYFENFDTNRLNLKQL